MSRHNQPPQPSLAGSRRTTQANPPPAELAIRAQADDPMLQRIRSAGWHHGIAASSALGTVLRASPSGWRPQPLRQHKRSQPAPAAAPAARPSASADRRAQGQNPMQRDAPPAERAAAPASSRGAAEPLSRNPMHPEPPASRCGPLRNGNPRGNPNAAPRCGARTRSGCPCRAPAMRGKLRCRMHGGASTGPRTAAGLERLRAARTIHGRYAARMRSLRRWTLSGIRRACVAAEALRLWRWLPPLAQARLDSGAPELLGLPTMPPDRPPPTRAQDRAIALAEQRALAPWKRAVACARTARRSAGCVPGEGREVDRLFAAMPPAPGGFWPGAHAP